MRNINKTSSYTKLVALLAGATLFGLLSQSALALGTLSGTTITNNASLSYTVGAVTTSIDTTLTPAQFKVDTKVNLTVVKVGAAPTSVVSDPLLGVVATTSFTVSNLGNSSHDFNLVINGLLANGTADPFGVGPVDNFNVSLCSVTGVVFGGVGSWAGAGNDFIDGLAADATATVTVSCTIPAAQADNSLAVISLLATARVDNAIAGTLGAALPAEGPNNVDPMIVDFVYADGANADDALRDAAHSDRSAYWVQTAVLSITKSATLLCDPINNNGANKAYIPGAVVQYAITIINTGTAAATLNTVTDTLQVANLALDGTLTDGTGVCGVGFSQSGTGYGAVKGTGVASTYAAPGPGTVAQAVTAGVAFASPTITITFANLAGTQIGIAGASSSLPAGDFITVYFNAIVQ